jgi:hypothetical protein
MYSGIGYRETVLLQEVIIRQLFEMFPIFYEALSTLTCSEGLANEHYPEHLKIFYVFPTIFVDIFNFNYSKHNNN